MRETMPTPNETAVARLGSCERTSPLAKSGRRVFAGDHERVLLNSELQEIKAFTEKGLDPPSFEKAGPRAELFFEPSATTCGIVTCGGLCPGLNNVIRALVLTAHHGYGVKRILGFRYGYQGMSSNSTCDPFELTPDGVDHIHEQGGTMLGSSRGPQDEGDMVTTLRKHGVDILFVIGGDGTLRGGSELSKEIAKQGVPISVIGIPKTIDNQDGTDDSGNVKLNDIGVFLRESISEGFKAKGMACSIKYIDPSYTIRSLPACGIDATGQPERMKTESDS